MATHENPQLEAQILANPDDISAYLVYGDWLIERGDPRGELIAVQAKLLDSPTDAALKATEAKLLADNAKRWLGALAKATEKDFAVTWRLGFLDSFRLGPRLSAYETSRLPFGETLEQLVDLPVARLLREIVVGSKDYDDYPTSWQDCIDALATRGVPPALARLAFDCGGYWDISSTELGDLTALYPRLSTLRELRVRMGAMRFGTMNLPCLESLEIVTGGLTGDNVASIAGGSWPRLRRLSLCIGASDGDHGCNVTLEDLKRLIASPGLGAVRHLGLCNTSLADEITAELVGTKLLAQLESLDLSKGTFGDEGARAILAAPGAFAHLATIDLTHHYVSDALQAELEKVGPAIILAEPETPEDDEYRYVQISE